MFIFFFFIYRVSMLKHDISLTYAGVYSSALLYMILFFLFFSMGSRSFYMLVCSGVWVSGITQFFLLLKSFSQLLRTTSICFFVFFFIVFRMYIYKLIIVFRNVVWCSCECLCVCVLFFSIIVWGSWRVTFSFRFSRFLNLFLRPR